jgi:hypothetical protein
MLEDLIVGFQEVPAEHETWDVLRRVVSCNIFFGVLLYAMCKLFALLLKAIVLFFVM